MAPMDTRWLVGWLLACFMLVWFVWSYGWCLGWGIQILKTTTILNDKDALLTWLVVEWGRVEYEKQPIVEVGIGSWCIKANNRSEKSHSS